MSAAMRQYTSAADPTAEAMTMAVSVAATAHAAASTAGAIFRGDSRVMPHPPRALGAPSIETLRAREGEMIIGAAEAAASAMDGRVKRPAPGPAFPAAPKRVAAADERAPPAGAARAGLAQLVSFGGETWQGRRAQQEDRFSAHVRIRVPRAPPRAPACAFWPRVGAATAAGAPVAPTAGAAAADEAASGALMDDSADADTNAAVAYADAACRGAVRGGVVGAARGCSGGGWLWPRTVAAEAEPSSAPPPSDEEGWVGEAPARDTPHPPPPGAASFPPPPSGAAHAGARRGAADRAEGAADAGAAPPAARLRTGHAHDAAEGGAGAGEARAARATNADDGPFSCNARAMSPPSHAAPPSQAPPSPAAAACPELPDLPDLLFDAPVDGHGGTARMPASSARGASPDLPDLLFYALFDGHGGTACAEYAAARLHGALGEALATTHGAGASAAAHTPVLPPPLPAAAPAVAQPAQLLSPSPSSRLMSGRGHCDVRAQLLSRLAERVGSALAAAFSRCDDEFLEMAARGHEARAAEADARARAAAARMPCATPCALRQIASSGGGGSTALALVLCRLPDERADARARDDDGDGDDDCEAERAAAATALAVAHVGDCRALLCRGGRALPLTADHRPDRHDEALRVRAAGGRVVNLQGVLRVTTPAAPPAAAAAGASSGVASAAGCGGAPVPAPEPRARAPAPAQSADGACGLPTPTLRRLRPYLAMSRCLGDLPLKRPLAICSAVPEVALAAPLQRDDLFAVCVSDGVTDVLTNEQVVAIAASRWPDAAAAARAVAAAAYDQGSSDNITALVITFGWNSAERGRRILAAAAADDADAAVRAVRGGTRGGPTGGLGGGDPRSAGSSAASGTQLSGVTVSSGSAFISPAELAVGANAVHAASWPLGALS
ncbi:hypothetical protein KFE25_004451 [Diacronema lutheri]|uniref:PPM-type phosphatase domain-containing protein n=1 Tax=Diacronema lutheri TaxID=2081491 RepID=A0A8J5X629_DIALT|nr:hypothetical protein KFE25_004451 [Diacronema lutheri]